MPRRLLIVEKKGVLAALAAAALRDGEWVQTSSSDPEEALSMVAAKVPDVLVAASDLGETDGYVFARKVKGVEGALYLPVVVADPEVDAVGPRMSHNSFAVKFPLDGEDFKRMLERALATQQNDNRSADNNMDDKGNNDLSGTISLEEIFAPDADGLEVIPGNGPDEDGAQAVEIEEVLELTDEDGTLELIESIELAEVGEEYVDEFSSGALAGEGVPADNGDIRDTDIEPEVDPVLEEVTVLRATDDATDLEPPATQANKLPEAESDLPPLADVEEEGLMDSAAKFAPPGEDPGASVRGDGGDALFAGDLEAAVRAAIEEGLKKALSPETISALVAKKVEKIVWEVVPPMAEKLILSAIEKLKNAPEEG